MWLQGQGPRGQKQVHGDSNEAEDHTDRWDALAIGDIQWD